MFDPSANINSDASIGDVPGDDIGGGAGTGDGTGSALFYLAHDGGYYGSGGEFFDVCLGASKGRCQV